MFACAMHMLEKTAACALFIRPYILIRVMWYRIELKSWDRHSSITYVQHSLSLPHPLAES
jgi:hypothetical protein